MNKALCDEFLKICIEHYRKVCEEGMTQDDQEYYGTPPESIVISFGSSRDNNDWEPLSAKEAVFRYSSQGLRSVSLDTVPDNTENRMYYKEAYAELCCQENGIAFMMIRFGKRYARCYRYNIVMSEKNVQLTDEELLWIS